jgi:hypothetical protein
MSPCLVIGFFACKDAVAANMSVAHAQASATRMSLLLLKVFGFDMVNTSSAYPCTPP